ncbi:hypothetical protein I6B53_04825 [Schaalia sp. 19OD2882]|uniref:hypothetical protein n=1 Tax=Schaalia sp. 19OD2882 TaxID=2794089 RepID=UPI001C1EAB6D|nr:hypothetical protein [Schaalia sp. 19OD2882]QWW20407.1 hypothetical protein I6B53_04825 [Schaalia sp. 19OD2882]
MKNSIIRTALAATLALGLGAGLAACGGATTGGDAAASGAATSSQSAGSQTAQGEDAETKADLELALKTVKDTLAEQPDLPKVYLAGDVDKPTEKYGMLVVPYKHSDATEKLTTSIVEIKDGKYVIGALAKESQKTWQIDQDGNISEKTK